MFVGRAGQSEFRKHELRTFQSTLVMQVTAAAPQTDLPKAVNPAGGKSSVKQQEMVLYILYDSNQNLSLPS